MFARHRATRASPSLPAIDFARLTRAVEASRLALELRTTIKYTAVRPGSSAAARMRVAPGGRARWRADRCRRSPCRRTHRILWDAGRRRVVAPRRRGPGAGGGRRGSLSPRRLHRHDHEHWRRAGGADPLLRKDGLPADWHRALGQASVQARDPRREDGEATVAMISPAAW